MVCLDHPGGEERKKAEMTMQSTVAIVNWVAGDGKAKSIANELIKLGHHPIHFKYDGAVPMEADVVLSFAPYNRFLPIACQFASVLVDRRPVFVHWNSEGIPNPRVPWVVASRICDFRSWVDRLNDVDETWARLLLSKSPLAWVNKRLHRFRYVGDYRYAYRRGWLDILADFSEIYAQLHRSHGLPAIFVPWGTSPDWYDNLDLERDIDVLWMGAQRNRRRRNLLDRVRRQLSASGVKMYMADNVEHPYIWGRVRTQFLNRAKITLNINTLWYDYPFSTRFHMAAGNRSLVVSETFLPHSSLYKAGVHYISTPADKLAETILYYLEHEHERQAIVERAYRLVTTELTLGNSLKIIMAAADKVKHGVAC